MRLDVKSPFGGEGATMNDEQHDPDAAMELFEDLAREVLETLHRRVEVLLFVAAHLYAPGCFIEHTTSVPLSSINRAVKEVIFS